MDGMTSSARAACVSASAVGAAWAGSVSARRLATLAWALSLVTAVPTLVLLAIGPGRVLPSDIFAGVGGGSFLILALTFASVGVIIARRVPDNRIGWVFCLTGLANSVQLLSWQYADVGLHRTDRLSGAAAAAVFNSMIGEATAGLLGLSVLLFPDGRLLSRRWRPALFSLLAGMALLVLAGTLRPGRFAQPFAAASNPLGVPGAHAAMRAVDMVGWLFVLAGIGFAAVALVVRLRRARGIERQQLKLVLAVGARRGGRGCSLDVDLAGLAERSPPASHRGPRSLLRDVSGRRRHRDSPLPPVRHRRRHQPHARLRRGHARVGRRVCGDHSAARDGARARLGLGDRGRDARRRDRLSPPARAGAGRRRPPIQPRPLRRVAPDGRLSRSAPRRPGRARGRGGIPARSPWRPASRGSVLPARERVVRRLARHPRRGRR